MQGKQRDGRQRGRQRPAVVKSRGLRALSLLCVPSPSMTEATDRAARALREGGGGRGLNGAEEPPDSRFGCQQDPPGSSNSLMGLSPGTGVSSSHNKPRTRPLDRPAVSGRPKPRPAQSSRISWTRSGEVLKVAVEYLSALQRLAVSAPPRFFAAVQHLTTAMSREPNAPLFEPLS